MNTPADVCAVILAAGKGSRMKSDLAKVLHRMAGRPLVQHVLDAFRQAGVNRSVVVVGHQREEVERVVMAPDVTCVLQDRQLGTGHAVLVTEAAVASGTVVVACGDAPLVPAALLKDLIAKHHREGNACTGVAARLKDPTGYGRMVTDAQGCLKAIVEHKDASPEIRRIDLVNSGLFAFARAPLFACLHRLKPENAQGEYYLTDVVRMLVNEGQRVGLVTTDDAAAVLGVNTPEDLAQAERLFARRD